MPELDYRYDPSGQPAYDVELQAFGFGCGATDVDGICSAVLLRMVASTGVMTVMSRVEMTPEVARALAEKLQDMAAKVDAKESVPT